MRYHSCQFVLGHGQRVSQLPQRRQLQHFGAHSTVALIFCQQVGPVQLRQSPLSERTTYQCSVRLKSPQVLSKQVFLASGVMGRQGCEEQVELVLFRQPSICITYIPHFLHSSRLQQFLQCSVANIVNDGDSGLSGIDSEFGIMFMQKGKDELWSSAVDANTGEGTFDISHHISNEGIGQLLQLLQLRWQL